MLLCSVTNAYVNSPSSPSLEMMTSAISYKGSSAVVASFSFAIGSGADFPNEICVPAKSIWIVTGSVLIAYVYEFADPPSAILL